MQIQRLYDRKCITSTELCFMWHHVTRRLQMFKEFSSHVTCSGAFPSLRFPLKTFDSVETPEQLCVNEEKRSYKDLRLLRPEVPLDAGVCVGVERDLDDSFLHRLHRLHQICIVAGDRHAAEPGRLERQTVTQVSCRLKTSSSGSLQLHVSSPGSRVCRAALQRTTGRSSPRRQRRCTSAQSCSWFSTPPLGSFCPSFGSWRLGSECGSAEEASAAGSARPESAVTSECHTEASGRIAASAQTPESGRANDAAAEAATWLVMQSGHT